MSFTGPQLQHRVAAAFTNETTNSLHESRQPSPISLAPGQSAQGRGARLKQRVLLVLEDEEARLLRDWLGNSCEVERASFQSAGEALAQGQYDACLMDDCFVGSSGAQLRGILAQKRVPLVLLLDAGNPDPDLAELGASDYLVKDNLSASLVQRSVRYAIERGRSEAALVEAQSFAQATIDALPANIAVLDERGTIIAVNAAWRDFAGANCVAGSNCVAGENCVARADGFVGASSGIGTNYLDACEQSGAAPTRATADGIRAIIAGQETSFCLEYYSHNSDARCWFQMCATRFAGAGAHHVVVAHEDISARKHAEEKLRQSEASLAKAQQVAGIGSWELDLPTSEDAGVKTLRWSDEVFRIFSFEPGETEVSADTFWAAVHPDDREGVTEFFNCARSARQSLD